MCKKWTTLFFGILLVALAGGLAGCGGSSGGGSESTQAQVPQKVEAPTFSPAGGTFSTAQTVTISTATPGASIRYTTDGSTPTSTSGKLIQAGSGTVTVSAGQTLIAIAFETGFTDSELATVTFAISALPPPTVETPTFSPPGGTFASAQTVTISTATPGASLRYTTDGSTPTETSGTLILANSGTVTVSGSQTLSAIAFQGGSNDSAVAVANFTISPPPPPGTAETPTFNPPAGAFALAQNVTISTATPGASIRVTTDGSTPTATSGTLIQASSGTVTVSASQTLAAIAFEPGFNDSAVAIAGYAIGTPIPTAPAGLPASAAASTGFNVQTPAAPVVHPGAARVSLVPQPTGGTIIDKNAAIRLGKALFWDTQAGSDGQVACATCHFHGGADSRTLNTVNPGPDALFDNGVVTGPGQSFPSALFLSFPVANTASDDAVGSQGVFSRAFLGISPDLADPVDACAPLGPADPAQATLFNHAPEQRLITHRNTPTMIGAVFNFDSFWDGRASHDFNGLNPLGRAGGNPILGPTVLVGSNSSLASQAVGPPLSNVEMSCANRAFNGPNSLGAKLVLRTPLASQPVDPADSMLGPLSNAPASGLQCGFPDRLCTYADLIAAAFGTGGLSGQAAVDSFVNNFASIWGQAVQAYEATLIPDRTPYDLGTLTPNQQAGLNAFRGQPATGCTTCHVEPEFTDATVRLIRVDPATGVPPPKLAGGDQGFHDVGAAPSAADHGRRDSLGGVYNPSPRNDGAFKTAALRNVKLTAPYFHNGKLATLDEVVRFYNNSPNGVQVRANAGFDPDAAVNIAGGSIAAVVDFLQNGLTDCRVEHELAPFDHPAIAVPGGPTLPARGAAGDGTVCP